VAERREYLINEFGVLADADNLKTAKDADLVVFAVKPQDLGSVMAQLNGHLGPQQAALSIVAGAKMETLTKGLGHQAVVRVMPNTPAQIGEGMTLWTCSDGVDNSRREMTKSVLGTIGQEIYVSDEKYMDMATALSASGPAYVFLFIEALIDAGVYVGMPRDMARTLALQTVFGSAKLVMDTGMHPAELKDMVVSPGGTTAEALKVLEDRGVPAAIVSAVDAAYRKSIQLGQG
jgi:pyrroline-5-carboxylate reductase